MKVCEIFKSIQGEGRWAGYPAVFVRLSGCNLNCPWCDTRYHKKGKEMTIEEVAEEIVDMVNGRDVIVFTEGEPMLQWKEVKELMYTLRIEYGCMLNPFHLETNGTILRKDMLELFDYISFSPKDTKTARRIRAFLRKYDDSCVCVFGNCDIKVVTDLEKVGVDLIPYASMLMPLTTGDKRKDRKIQKKVWKYCVENGLKYSPRLHIDVWGKIRRR